MMKLTDLFEGLLVKRMTTVATILVLAKKPSFDTKQNGRLIDRAIRWTSTLLPHKAHSK